MLVEYKRDLSHNYMLIHAEEEIPTDSFEMRVLMSNRIPGILPMDYEEVNGSTAYRYDVTSCQPFHVLCSSGRMTAGILRELFSNLLDNLLSFEDYLLDSSRLMLDADYLFVRWEELTLMVPYVPDYKQEIRRSLITLTESVIMQISHGQEDCIVLACQFLHELQKKELQLEDLRAFLEAAPEERRIEPSFEPDLKENSGEYAPDSLPLNESFEESEPPWSGNAVCEEDRKPAREAALSGAIRTGLPEKETIRMALIAAIPAALLYVLLQLQSFCLLSFTETAGAALLTAAVILLILRIAQKRREARKSSIYSRPSPGYAPLKYEREEARSGPALIPANPSDGLSPILVRGKELLIGKQRSLADAVIDKDGVSRLHARIFRKNNAYYLSDMGSKNGTSIDGRLVVGREEVPLTDGAQVTFSDYTYIFRA